MSTDLARPVQRIEPGTFESLHHFYPRVPNAQLHPMVRSFMMLDNERIARRYCHLHPEVSGAAVREALAHQPQHLRWSGADLFHTTNERGHRHMVVIEVNSSPSGQKSMPPIQEEQEQAGYRVLLSRAFVPTMQRSSLPEGGLAVLWDKNAMEVGGYAHVLADLTGESVYLVHCPVDAPDPSHRFREGVLEIRNEAGDWLPIRAAMRYVTQRPWTRIPPVTRTLLFNPVVACLAGGRNKLLAAKAYDIRNAALARGGLHIHVPETIWDVSQQEVPIWVTRMGGVAVVKDPYSNAGQGIYTITSAAELEAFMRKVHRYGQFIVQGLIGNAGWSSITQNGRLYHVGTVPDRRGDIFAADLRMMVGTGPEGFFPVALYARRARTPLAEVLPEGVPSWDMLGTNLSVKDREGQWDTEPKRLMMMDSRDFNRLGLGLDDLIEAYLQTVLATTAIDEMAQTLISSEGHFRRDLFQSMTPDPGLLEDIIA